MVKFILCVTNQYKLCVLLIALCINILVIELTNILFCIGGYLKLNVDTGSNSAAGRMAFGWCLRDDKILFIQAIQVPYDQMWDVAIGEALGLLKSIHWVAYLNCTHIELESNCKAIVD